MFFFRVPCLGDGVTRDREEGERSAHDGHEASTDDDVGLGDLDLHHLDDGGDARRDQGRGDKVLRLLRSAVGIVFLSLLLPSLFSSISRNVREAGGQGGEGHGKNNIEKWNQQHFVSAHEQAIYKGHTPNDTKQHCSPSRANKGRGVKDPFHSCLF